jgi:arylsulfatase A-like enzyme
MNKIKEDVVSIREPINSGALYGAVSWTVYAITECFFTIILPWIIKPGYDYTPLHPDFTVLLFIIYPVIGLILGGFIGLCFKVAKGRIQFFEKIQPEVFLSSFATLSIVLALSADYVFLLTTGFSIKHLAAPLGLAALLALVLLFSALSHSWYRRFRFLANPWTSCILLLGVVGITREHMINYSTAYKAAASIVYPIVVISIVYFIQKTAEKLWTRNRRESLPVLTARSVVIIVFIAIAFLGVSFFPRQTHRIQHINAGTAPASADRPNVILVVMDTVRADHLPMYGYDRDTTPNIRKFSEQATLFSQSFASGSMTLSTHASIFTGLYAFQHGAHYTAQLPEGQPLSENFHTIAEELNEKGYLTFGIVSNFGFLSHVFHMDQGFQYFDNRVPVHFFSPARPYYLRQIVGMLLTRYVSPVKHADAYKKAEDINKEVYSLLDKVKKERQAFFLFINYMDAHRPYNIPPPFDTLYPGKNDSINAFPNNRMSEEIMKLKRGITDEERSHLISQYDGGIAYMDFQIGELIKRLKKIGLYENSLIIITSDHGEAFGERNLMEHGSSVYQDQVYVPLIVKFPKAHEGHVVNEIVNSVDLMPTILDVLGYEISKDIQGMSLQSLKHEKSRNIISESYPNNYLLSWHSRFHRVERAIYSWPYKFISSTAGKKELYDLSRDPDEKVNLYRSDDRISGELELQLNQRLNSVAVKFPPPAKLDEGALDRLKALGYVK